MYSRILKCYFYNSYSGLPLILFWDDSTFRKKNILKLFLDTCYIFLVLDLLYRKNWSYLCWIQLEARWQARPETLGSCMIDVCVLLFMYHCSWSFWSMRIPVYQTEITFMTPQLKNIQEIATFFDYTSKAILMDFWSFKFQL